MPEDLEHYNAHREDLRGSSQGGEKADPTVATEVTSPALGSWSEHVLHSNPTRKAQEIRLQAQFSAAQKGLVETLQRLSLAAGGGDEGGPRGEVSS